MEVTLDHDTMLDVAMCQRNTTLSGSLNDEIVLLKSANSSLANTIETLHDNNTRVHEELNEALRAISKAMINAECICTNKDKAAEQANITIQELHDRIGGLNEQIDDMEHGRSPDRKRLCRYTQSPTIPDYRHTPSRQSN
jgi:uncharacterized coiled-coil DUF342 family protein